MSIKSFSLALITTATAALTANQSAFAGEVNARFTYAPNVWKVEGVRVPTSAETPHSVQSGGVPQGPGFLGLSPQMLAKPTPPAPPTAPPQVKTEVAAKPSVNRAVPQLEPKPQYNPSFGKAGSLAPPVVASAPPPTQSEAKANPGQLDKPQAAHHNWQSSRNVHGVLTHKRSGQPNGLAAAPAKPIASYGAGYVPGAFLPTADSGDGSSSQANVHGKILLKR